jgi:hypothetical protein
MRRVAICTRRADAPGRAFLVVVAVLVTGCGGESAKSDDSAQAPAAPTAPEHACALLPAAEVTAVLGESVRDSLALRVPDGSGAVTLSQCNYATASNAAAVSLMLRRSSAGETAAQALQSVRETIEQAGASVEDVPGLGEGAIWGGNQLHVITGRGWSIVVSPPASGGLAQTRAIAERAIARM